MQKYLVILLFSLEVFAQPATINVVSSNRFNAFVDTRLGKAPSTVVSNAIVTIGSSLTNFVYSTEAHLGAGSSSAPSLTVGTDFTTGIYQVGVGMWGLVVGGTNFYTFNSSGLFAVTNKSLGSTTFPWLNVAASAVISGGSLNTQTNITTSAIGATNFLGVGSLTTNATAILQADSTTKGFLPPRMTKAQRNAIVSPAEGLIINQTDSTPGPRVYTSGAWNILNLTADP